MAESVPATSSPRNLERCPHCDYRLDGLPDTGRCPECGSDYNQEVIILYGWGGVVDEYNQFSRGDWTQMMFIWGPAVLFSLFVFCISPWLCLVPITGATIAYVAARHDIGEAPPGMLALHACGWAWAYSASSADRVRLYRIGTAGIWLTPCLIYIYFLRAGLVYVVAIWAAGLAWSLLWRSVRRYFWRRRSAASGRRLAPQWTPWAEVNHIALTPNRRGKWCIRLRLKGIMKHLRSGPYRRDFSFECELPDARRDHILRQIAAWPVELRVEKLTSPPRPPRGGRT